MEAKGRKWKAIGEEVGRLAMACRDRYRELETSSESNHKKGAWTEEECEQLQAAVQEHLRTKQVGVVLFIAGNVRSRVSTGISQTIFSLFTDSCEDWMLT